jgi:hypothetical protein
MSVCTARTNGSTVGVGAAGMTGTSDGVSSLSSSSESGAGDDAGDAASAPEAAGAAAAWLAMFAAARAAAARCEGRARGAGRAGGSWVAATSGRSGGASEGGAAVGRAAGGSAVAAEGATAAGGAGGASAATALAGSVTRAARRAPTTNAPTMASPRSAPRTAPRDFDAGVFLASRVVPSGVMTVATTGATDARAADEGGSLAGLRVGSAGSTGRPAVGTPCDAVRAGAIDGSGAARGTRTSSFAGMLRRGGGIGGGETAATESRRGRGPADPNGAGASDGAATPGWLGSIFRNTRRLPGVDDMTSP